MRVLHVYSGNLFGGIERMLISVASLQEPECQHSFALCFEGRLSQALRKYGATLHVLPAARIKRPLTVLRARAALRRALRDREVDAVICHGVWSYCVFAAAVRATNKIPILYMHDAPEPGRAYYRWAWLKRPQLCLANSAYIARLAADMRPAVRVEVVHPLVPEPEPPAPAATSALREALGANDRSLVILQASRLDPWKGHRNLLDALRALHDVPDWVCWVAGAPQRPQEVNYHKELLASVSQYGLEDRVKFIGHRDDMGMVLAACDIYCQPNETPEPFGMVFVEALFAGKPVVGSASGGTLDIVSPDCGVLCTSGDGSLVLALASLIKNPELRARMSRNGPVRARDLCGARNFTSRLQEALQAVRSEP